jgi:hypothetical protein
MIVAVIVLLLLAVYLGILTYSPGLPKEARPLTLGMALLLVVGAILVLLGK